MIELKNTQTNFKRLLEVMMDATVLLDLEYSVIDTNRAFETLFGLNRKEVAGKSLLDLIIPRNVREQVTHIRNAVASGETIRLETVRLHRDGRLIPVGVTVYPIILGTSPAGFWSVYVDLSERVRTEKILQESENLLRDFAHAVPDMSFVIDEDGRYVEVFGNVEKMLGKSKEEVLGYSLYELFPYDIAQLFLSIVQEVIASGSAKYSIREMEVKNKIITAEERVLPLRYTVNGKKAVGVVITDITGRRHMDRMLSLAYELQRRNDFINGIIFGNNAIDEAAIYLARKLGVDFSIPLLCFILRSEEYADTGMGNAESHERRKLKGSLIDLLESDSNYTVWDCRSDIGVLCQARNPPGRDAGEKDLACRLREKVHDFASKLKVIIGVGNIQTGPEGIRKSYQHAWSAVISAQYQDEAKKEDGIYYYKELGILKFLINYSEENYVDEFIEETIGKLIEYDQNRGTDLLITLEAIVQTFTLQAAAEKAFLHPKTIYYRKQRIQKILECSLDTIDMRLAMAMAIKLYKIKKICRGFPN